MGVAWRGNVKPIEHIPDPSVAWPLPSHLRGYRISGSYEDPARDLANPEFPQLLAAIRPYTLLSERRLLSLFNLAKRICLENLPGNFVECGAWRGGATALLGFVIKQYSKMPRRVFCFDTFDGMPEPADVDKQHGIPANSTAFGAGTLKAPLAENLDVICRQLGVRDLVNPIQGLFADTLPKKKTEIGSIALLHADADWYASMLDVFTNLYDQVVPNGFIQIDDFNHWEGCHKAVRDFEQKRGLSFFLNPIDDGGVWLLKAPAAQKPVPVTPNTPYR